MRSLFVAVEFDWGEYVAGATNPQPQCDETHNHGCQRQLLAPVDEYRARGPLRMEAKVCESSRAPALLVDSVLPLYSHCKRPEDAAPRSTKNEIQ